VTRAIQFTQAQIRRAVRGAEAAGMRVTGVTVHRDGSITVESREAAAPEAIDTRNGPLAASWDDFA
jgi:hypothetical protein